MKRVAGLAAAGIAAGLLGACANNGSLLGTSLTTSSVDQTAPAKTAAAAKIDPACVQLTAKIDALRKEGFVERVEKASVGKTSTVQMKRASLAKMAELDKANAEFQSRCSTLPTLAPQNQAQQAPAGAAPAAAAQAGQAAAAGSNTGAAAQQAQTKAAAAAAAPAVAPAGQP